MKKLIALFLIPVFLLMTAGVAITSLYCQGKISDVGITVKACCKDVDKGGCCNTKSEIVKVKDAFLSTSASFDFNHSIVLYIPAFQIPDVSALISNFYFKTYWDKAPPILKGELYILFRSLII
jgi:hypothetical protein